MKIRIYTNDTYLDVDTKDIYTQDMLIEGLESGNTIAITKADDNIFILNSINIIAIEILNSNIPPINNKKEL